MTRTDLPLLLLAEPVATRPAPQARLTFTDTAFLLAALAIVAGGCLWLLDMAAARSSGQEPVSAHLFEHLSNMSTWVSGLMTGSFKYMLLLIASILNSGLIVSLVYSLRSLDRGVHRATNRASFKLTPLRKAQNIRRPRNQARAAAPYLLSPVFR